MENNPANGGKSAKFPPKRGQVIIKTLERMAGIAKDSKARVGASPDDQGGSGKGGGSNTCSGSGVRN